jgi:glycosyltransferase involved in cell wall biosynthesis
MTLPRGATYINVGHSGLEQPRLLARLDRAGIRSIVMIHDLIPITYPEYCGPGAALRHHQRLEATLAHAAAILTNSAATAQDVRDYAAAGSRRVPPIFEAPLGLEPAFLEPLKEPIAALPYFVCVGTIEPRKNLVMLLKLWRRLADRLGPSTPRLVLVGRRGWENETVLDHLQRSPPVRKYVHEIADLRDDELARLIRGARALLSPSATEGFDLPVVEALALGTPVIASDIPAHRELAHGAVLIDPTDGPGWYQAISAAASRPRRRITNFVAPTWSDHFEIVARAIAMADEDHRGPSGQTPKPWAREG